MVLTLPFKNVTVHQSILLTGLQHVLLHLQWPILIYHNGHPDIDLIVENLSASHSLYVANVPETNPQRADLVQPKSTVFLATNPAIVDFHFRKWAFWNAHGKILVILDDSQYVQEWITRLWEITRAVDVLVMVVNETASFFTWFPYRKQECLSVTTISKLEPPHLFPDKIVPPLHGCPIKGMTSVLPPLVSDENRGLETRLFHVLAEKVGLQVQFVDLPEGQYVWSLFDEAGEPFNGMKYLWENEIDMLFSALNPSFVMEFSDFLPPHYQEQMKWFVPAPKLASKRKSIYRAFSSKMWLLVFSSFICLLGTLVMVSLLYDSPMFNLGLNTIAINLSMPSKFVKSQRFLVFIAFAYLYSLHITTAYQSSFIIFLSDIPREKPITTLEEFQEANLEIMLHAGQKPFTDQLAESLTYKEILRPEKVTYHSYLHLERIVETGTCALLGPYSAFSFSLTSNPAYFYDEDGFPKILILKNYVVLSSNVMFLMPKGHPLVALFSRYVLDLLAAGIPDQFLQELLKQNPHFNKKIEPFGMDEIEGPFYLFLVLVSLSIFAWIIELIFHYFQQKFQSPECDRSPRRQETTFSRLRLLLVRK